MTRYTSVSAFTLRALCAVALALSVSTMSRAGNTVVYRCLDAHLGVLYTDVPCKDGTSFDVQTGEADQAAIAKLERARDALEQSATQRIIDERRIAGERALAGQYRAQASDGRSSEDGYADGGYYTYPVAGYGSGYGNWPMRPHPAPRHRPMKPSMPRGGAPSPPYIVPRT